MPLRQSKVKLGQLLFKKECLKFISKIALRESKHSDIILLIEASFAVNDPRGVECFQCLLDINADICWIASGGRRNFYFPTDALMLFAILIGLRVFGVSSSH